jgi:ATP synthase mitochondrial F1 complex assembly factor 1
MTRRSFSFSYPCPRKLREIMKLSAIEKETPETIEMIWREYHNAKPFTVSRVLSTSLYL